MSACAERAVLAQRLRAAFRDGAGALMRFDELIERGISAIRSVDKSQAIEL